MKLGCRCGLKRFINDLMTDKSFFKCALCDLQFIIKF